MGCWEEMCVVCGGPPHAPEHSLDWLALEDMEESAKEKLRASLRGLEWLSEYVGIPATEESIPLGGYTMYGSFDIVPSSGGQSYEFQGATIFRFDKASLGHDPTEDLYGLTCHAKCRSLLQRELHYTLRFRDVWPLLMQQELGNYFDWTSYGGMAKYQTQDFSFLELVSDGNAWMLQDPTTNSANTERILDVWRPLLQNGFQKYDAQDHRTGDAPIPGQTVCEISATVSETAPPG